jgi:DNA-binding MarR family transcriptional regulator
MVRRKTTGRPAGPGTATGHGAPPAELLGHVGFLLNRAALLVREGFAEALRPLGVTPRHYGVLTYLAEAGPCTQQEIGERVLADRTTMVSVVDDLERLGLACRGPQPGDRRAYSVHLTGKGRQMQARARSVARAVNREFLQSLSAKEQHELRGLLRRVVLARYAGRR